MPPGGLMPRARCTPTAATETTAAALVDHAALEPARGALQRDALRCVLETGLLAKALGMRRIQGLRRVSRGWQEWAVAGHRLAMQLVLQNAPASECRLVCRDVMLHAAEDLEFVLKLAHKTVLEEEILQLTNEWRYAQVKQPSLLSLAVETRSLSKVQLLLLHGWSQTLMLENAKGRNCLYNAAADGRLDIVSALLDSACPSVLVLQPHGLDENETCLHAALPFPEIMRVILDKAAAAKLLPELLLGQADHPLKSPLLDALRRNAPLSSVEQLLEAAGQASVIGKLLLLKDDAPEDWEQVTDMNCLDVVVRLRQPRKLKAILQAAAGTPGLLAQMLLSQPSNDPGSLLVAVRESSVSMLAPLMDAAAAARVLPALLLEPERGLPMHFICLTDDDARGLAVLSTLLSGAGAYASSMLLQENEFGRTCLHRAVESDKARFVRGMLEAAGRLGVREQLWVKTDRYRRGIPGTNEPTFPPLAAVEGAEMREALCVGVSVAELERSMSDLQQEMHLLKENLAATSSQLAARRSRTSFI